MGTNILFSCLKLDFYSDNFFSEYLEILTGNVSKINSDDLLKILFAHSKFS
jgi:hypothetical protein